MHFRIQIIFLLGHSIQDSAKKYHLHKSPPTSKSCGMKNISMITNTIWCFTQKWEIVPSKKTGFKVIIPKGGRGSGPNPKICCMCNWDMSGGG